MERVQPVSVLSIAGSDSGGGAGIQADLRTFAAFGVHGTTALTAITAQNTLGVGAVTVLSPALVVAQIRAVVEDFDVAAVKTGMLGDAAVVEAVAELVREGGLPSLVVDPVLVSTSEHSLMASGGVRAYREALLPLADVVTPNLPETAALTGADERELGTVAAMVDAGREISTWGVRYVLVKGGHLAGSDTSIDVLVGPDEVTVLEGARVSTTNDHGTGCSLSAALCAGRALGRSVEDATRDAKSFVLAALEGAADWRLGHGRGPIDHLGWSR